VQRLYQGHIADTEKRTARLLAAGKHRKTKATTGGRGCDDGIRELKILCRVPNFLDNYYIGVARTLAHRNGVFAPKTYAIACGHIPAPHCRPTATACVLTRNRIGPAIIL